VGLPISSALSVDNEAIFHVEIKWNGCSAVTGPYGGLGPGVFYLLDSENVVSHLLAGLSFLLLSISFLEKRPLQLGLLVSSVALTMKAIL